MALPGIRQPFIFEDPEFNLGMTPDAFRNLGLMGLPGANTTVANPKVVDQIQSAYVPESFIPEFGAPKSEPVELPVGMTLPPKSGFGFDSSLIGTQTANLYEALLGRSPDKTGLEYWNREIGPTADQNEIVRFLEAARPELEARTTFQPPVVDTFTDTSAVIPKTITPITPTKDVKEVVDSGLTSTQTAATSATTAAPAVDTSNFPKFEGKPYDPAAYDNIVKQLTAQQQALLQQKNFPYTSTFGGAQETIADMAKRLAAMGISDIRDFGMKHELPVEKVYETIPGDEGGSMTFDTGRYRTVVGQRGYDSEGNPIFDYRDLTPEEIDKLKFRDGMGFLPVDQIKRADLKNSPYATTVYYNKKTGEQIDTRQFGGKAESGLFASSGAGDGYTNYRVVYDEEKGTPVFLPEKNLSGMKEFIAEDLSGILSVLRFIPGAQIPVMLAQAAAAAYMGAKPEDILKSAAISYLSSNLGKLGDKFLPQLGFDLPTSDLGKLAMNAGYSGLASLIQGGDFEDALKSAGLSAIGTGISGLLPKGGEGDFNYGRLIQAAAPALAKGKLTNADIFRIMSSLAPTKQKVPGKP